MDNDLIERAIQSAEARIYKLEHSKDRNHTERHREKADNQIELQLITIKALRKQEEVNVIEIERYGLPLFACPICHTDLYDGQPYCSECGQKMDWEEVE